MAWTDLVDRIYEAAFVPEHWPSVLERIGRQAQSASGALIVFEDIRPVRFMATPQIRPWTERFCAEQWKVSNRIPHIRRNPMVGFSVLTKYFGTDFMQRDTSHVHRIALGLDSEVGTAISMPTGDIVVFSFDKRRGHGLHDHEAVRFLNMLHPHLARAGLMATRLDVERANTTTSTLQTIGLPAAVLSASGRLLATNSLFDALSNIFMPAAFGRLAIADATASKQFASAIEAAAQPEGAGVASVAVPATAEHSACVAHVVPLRRSAYDLFRGGAIMVAITMPRSQGSAPSEEVLRRLFDLTSAETRFAMALSEGRSPKEAAREIGVTESSGRTYLARIFAKTGTHRQTELISLLHTARPFSVMS